MDANGTPRSNYALNTSKSRLRAASPRRRACASCRWLIVRPAGARQASPRLAIARAALRPPTFAPPPTTGPSPTWRTCKKRGSRQELCEAGRLRRSISAGTALCCLARRVPVARAQPMLKRCFTPASMSTGSTGRCLLMICSLSSTSRPNAFVFLRRVVCCSS